jgi:ABC-type nitrate/sulfonate/bicarbonate transport system substrate-binding protein
MQMQRQKLSGRRLAVFALVVGLILGPDWSHAATPEVINIAWTGEYWSTLPFRVAADRGFFEKENLYARFINFQSTQLITAALMQGDLDYGTTLAIAGAALRGLPLKIVGVVAKGTGYAIVSKREIDSLKGLKGKKFALNSFGSAPDYAVYTYFSKNGLDPNRDVTFLTIGGTAARFAALVGGTVDATVVSSPFEHIAEQQGFRTLVSLKELAEYVNLPYAGMAVTQEKIAKDGGQIVKALRALRAAMLFILEQRAVSVDLLAKTLKLNRAVAEKFYPLYRELYNPELTVPDSSLEEFIAVGNFRLKGAEKDKELLKIQVLRDWSFAEKAKQ